MLLPGIPFPSPSASLVFASEMKATFSSPRSLTAKVMFQVAYLKGTEGELVCLDKVFCLVALITFSNTNYIS